MPSLPRIGVLVPRSPWEGALLGVRGRAIAILHPDGALVSIVATIESMEGRGIAVGAEPYAACAERLAHAEGRRVSACLENGRLAFALAGEASASGPLAELDLRAAEPWDGAEELRAARTRLEHTALQALRLCAGLLQTIFRSERPRIGIHGDGPFAEGFHRLERDAAFPANLVGFGPGTTPAGDDWIAGWELARALVAPEKPRLFDASALALTSPAGATLLLGVLADVFPAYLLDFADAFAATCSDVSSPDRLEPALRRVLGHGASSGADAMAGFLAGLCMCLGGVREAATEPEIPCYHC